MNEIGDEDIGRIVNNLDVHDITEEKEFSEPSPYEATINKITSIAGDMHLSNSFIERIIEPDRILEIDIPVILERKSQGKDVVKVFTGYWVEHNNILGPYKGPLSFIQHFNVDDAKASALLEACKNSLISLPFGGAAGGTAVNKKILVPKELERLAKNYLNSLHRFLDFEKDILASGEGCDERMMSIMFNTYKEILKGKIKSNFLGKQMQDGGIKARDNAVASGIFCMIDEVLKQAEISEIPGLHKHEDIIKKTPREITVALAGFDAMEKELALMLCGAGYKLIAISDSYGGIASIKGIDPQEAARWQRNHTSVVGLPKTVRISNEQMLGVKADMLILSSSVNVNSNNMHRIKAGIVIELSPIISAMAKSELQKIKIVLPYIVASCPETFASYLEFQQNRENRFFDRKDIDKRIEEKSRDVINLVYSESKKHAKNLEDAAFILALQNIADSFSKK